MAKREWVSKSQSPNHHLGTYRLSNLDPQNLSEPQFTLFVMKLTALPTQNTVHRAGIFLALGSIVILFLLHFAQENRMHSHLRVFAHAVPTA